MIIKFAGMIIVVFSSAMIGFHFSDAMLQRERELLNLSDAVNLMIGELDYTHLGIKDIFFKVYPVVKGESKEFFKTVCNSLEMGEGASSAWGNAVEENTQFMSLKSADSQILEKSGYLLEAYGLDEQRSNLELLRERILLQASEAAQFRKKNSRVVKMLGIYGGILLCIIVF